MSDGSLGLRSVISMVGWCSQCRDVLTGQERWKISSGKEKCGIICGNHGDHVHGTAFWVWVKYFSLQGFRWVRIR